jgi:hypothetical protein
VRRTRRRWAETNADVGSGCGRERSLHISVSLFRGFSRSQYDDEPD